MTNNEKATTTVLIDAKLKETAIQNKISLSRTLEEALFLKLSIPKTQDKVIDELELARNKVLLLEKELKDVDLMKEADQVKQKINDKDKDIVFIRKKWADMLAGRISSEIYNKILRGFAAKWSIELAQVVALAESKAYKAVENAEEIKSEQTKEVVENGSEE